MKNLIKSIFVLLLLAFANCIHAQNACEFEKTYNYKEEGKKIIETKKKQFLIASVFGYQTNIFVGERLNLGLTKTDNCGNIIWSINPDSALNEGDRITILNLKEEENEDIMVIARYYKVNTDKNSYCFIKLDSSGNVKCKKYIGNNLTEKINIASIEKISENNLMFISIRDTNNQFMYQTLFFDTLNNLKSSIYFDSTSKKISIYYSFLEVYKQSDKLMTIVTNRDTNALKMLTIDTSGNVISSLNIVSSKGVGYTWATMNNNQNEYNVFTLYKDAPKRYVAKYSLTGQLYKDTVLTDTLFTKYEFLYINKNNYLLAKQNYLTLVDSNFKILWNVTVSNELTNSGFRYNSVINTFDNSLVVLGAESSSNGNGNLQLRWFIKKLNLLKFANKIQISGNSLIDQKNGSIQLTATILPTNAANQKILWSISDTNLATITQTGLVTAKGNGTVIVTAQTTDGSNLSATKAITITNQTVGINETEISNLISVYPNPASNSLTIVAPNNLTIQLLQLKDLTGKVLANFENKTELDISKIENGIYILTIETNNGMAFKKVLVSK